MALQPAASSAILMTSSNSPNEHPHQYGTYYITTMNGLEQQSVENSMIMFDLLH